MEVMVQKIGTKKIAHVKQQPHRHRHHQRSHGTAYIFQAIQIANKYETNSSN
jgi:hypothetical protein